jgi:hypothetical protein
MSNQELGNTGQLGYDKGLGWQHSLGSLNPREGMNGGATF